jgi:hypothetical protein
MRQRFDMTGGIEIIFLFTCEVNTDLDTGFCVTDRYSRTQRANWDPRSAVGTVTVFVASWPCLVPDSATRVEIVRNKYVL